MNKIKEQLKEEFDWFLTRSKIQWFPDCFLCCINDYDIKVSDMRIITMENILKIFIYKKDEIIYSKESIIDDIPEDILDDIIRIVALDEYREMKLKKIGI